MTTPPNQSNRAAPDEDPPATPARSPEQSPTTAAVRWSEIVENSHEGLAVLDADGRFEFVSDRTAAALETAERELLGRKVERAIPGLSNRDRVAIERSRVTDEPARLICTRRGRDGWIRAVRMTFVPRRDPRGGTILLTDDITALRVVQDQQRRVQHRLMAVDDEEQRRIRREIHDGPVQVLAALALRLGLIASDAVDPADLRRLEQAVESAGRDLQEILQTPPLSSGGTAKELFSQWATPLLDGSDLDLEIDDRTTRPPNRATTEALFVFVHETIKTARLADGRRTIDVVLEQRGDGFGITVSMPQRIDQPIDLEDQQHHRGEAERYAALLGGTLEHHVDGATVYRLAAVLPELDEQGWADPHPDDDGAVTDIAERRVDRSGYDTLSAADLEATAEASFQGLVELDADLRVSYVNESYATAFRRPVDAIVGSRFEDLFFPADYEQLRPHVDAVVRGSRVRLEWRRRNHAGEPRWTQVAASPRVDEAGRFQGALVMTADTTDLHVAEDLRDAVQVELEQARRAARQRTARRLDRPIRRLENAHERLVELISATEVDPALTTIQQQLEQSIVQLRASVGLLAEPDLADRSWRDALHGLLAELFPAGNVDLVVREQLERPLPANQGQLLTRVARDAVVDAVRERGARTVEVQLDEIGTGYRLEIVDDGAFRIDAGRPPADDAGRVLAEHVARNGGTIDVAARQPAGTIVTVTIPGADDRVVVV